MTTDGIARQDRTGQYRRVCDNATAVKAGKNSTGYDRALEGMVEGRMAVQGLAKMKRFSRVMAVKGRPKTDSLRQIGQHITWQSNIHNYYFKMFIT